MIVYGGTQNLLEFLNPIELVGQMGRPLKHLNCNISLLLQIPLGMLEGGSQVPGLFSQFYSSSEHRERPVLGRNSSFKVLENISAAKLLCRSRRNPKGFLL